MLTCYAIYRTVDNQRNILDFSLTEKRDKKATPIHTLLASLMSTQIGVQTFSPRESLRPFFSARSTLAGIEVSQIIKQHQTGARCQPENSFTS